MRQGCNLSSILFIIYILELGQRLSGSGSGEREVILYLKFADDIILIGTCEEDLDKLKQILEGWCFDFRMRVSAKKTQVLASGEYDWVIMDIDLGALIELKQVREYMYLGVEQKMSLEIMRAITRLKRTVPDQVAVYRALLKNVAVLGILYGVEALLIDEAVIVELDEIQWWVAKVLLGVNTSTINSVSTFT